MTKRKRISARIPATLHKAVKEKSKKRGMYMTDIIESLLSHWAKRN